MIDFNPIHYELNPLISQNVVTLDIEVEVEIEFLDLEVEVTI